jgi:N-acetylmuramoyl-L-alanine amidase CwlA
MEKYKIPQDNVIRHFDVNGKHCPAYWIEDGKWFNEFWNLLTKTTVVNGATDEVPATEDKKTEPAVSSEYKVGATYSVICAAINVRKAPGMNEALVGYKNLSADAQKHSNGGSALLNGTKVTCQEVKVVGSETWIKIPSGWCCAKNSVKTLIK